MKTLLWPQMVIAKTTGYTIEQSVIGKAGIGLGIFAGAGASNSAGIAFDPKGNIGIISRGGGAADLSSVFGGPSYKGVSSGNVVLGAAATISCGLTFHNKSNVTELSGSNNDAASIGVDIGKMFSGSISLGENNLGASFGVGIGAAISMIGTDNAVFATNLNDLGNFEDSIINSMSIANENSGSIMANFDFSEDNQISIIINVVNNSGEVIDTQNAITFYIDKEGATIYTNTVK
ncbi:MAG: hypothetical protein ACOCUV_01715 [bacterium]